MHRLCRQRRAAAENRSEPRERRKQMQSVKPQSSTPGGRELFQPIWKELREYLESRRRLMNEEIASYPTPIPRCDAQFNHLYEQRARLLRDLDRLVALETNGVERLDYRELIEGFLGSPAYADDEAENAIRSRLKAELSRIDR